MSNALNGPASIATLSFLAWQFGALSAEANPAGGTVAQGAASFNTAGSQLTINTSANTVINWQSFNIGAGETTTFVEPSSSSVVWNHINDANPSQILGSLSANGYVVLQNQNGFVVGGSATINTHGLLMTTSPTPPPNLSSGGAWQFDALPPTASIINYGQITVAGGPAFLIANNIINANDPIKGTGTISAEPGQIGLFAGQEVLVSTRPDGRGLSAKVTLPQGSVDNEGRLIADGGSIIAQAQTVNQNGLVQANSIQNNNGVIELVASDAVNLGANSTISASGANQGVSDAGTVIIKSDNTFSDQAGSAINIAGGAHGGDGGQVEISAPQMGSVQSGISGRAALGFVGGQLTIDPTDIVLDSAYVASLNNVISGGLSVVDLQADNNIELSTIWTLADSGSAAALNLTAGNSIILDGGAGIKAGKDWSVNLTAGTAFVPTVGQPTPPSGGGDGSYSYGVYLDDAVYGNAKNGAYIQTQDGDINVWAANEVIIHTVDLSGSSSSGTSSGAIRTLAGGNIDITAKYGDVNSGNDVYGYKFGQGATPYYRVNTAQLGGISTAAGGNVRITAGGDVISYLPTQNDYNTYGYTFDGGTGAFGVQPGNVSITAGGSVFGNYVVANGTGVINAGGDAGLSAGIDNPLAKDFALSLVKGGWTVNAQNIYLDDVLNPNGIFNDSGNNGAHYFDYDSAAYLSLNAANAVEISGAEVPLKPSTDGTPYLMPVLLPPSLSVVAGRGGLTLDTDVILFPSATGNGNENINVLNGGGFQSLENPNDLSDVNVYTLEMSDSGQQQWTTPGTLANETFGYNDRAATPPELKNPNPVEINVSGNITDVILRTAKQTEVAVGGNMFNASLIGENLHAGDLTSINVAGSISYSPVYVFTTVASSALEGNNWESTLGQLVDEVSSDPIVNNPIPIPDLANPSLLKNLAASALAFNPSTAPNLVYNPATSQLGYTYQMSSLVRSVLEGKLETISYSPAGIPEVKQGADGNYYFVTTQVSFVAPSVIESLYNEGQASVKSATALPYGFQLGGPGQFNVKAGSMDLGASGGIVSWGGANGGNNPGGVDYASLGALTYAAGGGASINVTVAHDLSMLTSTIASIDGGGVTVQTEPGMGGAINLGTAGLAFSPVNSGNIAYGIYAAGAGDVNVTADGNINVDTARIATFNGGNVVVTSENGDVNAGNGVNMDLYVPFYSYDPKTGIGVNTTIQTPRPYGSGIMALSPVAKYQVSSKELPGNITVDAPNGNIVSTLGGIAQFALDNSIGAGPAVNLNAGKDIDLGQGGVIGGAVNLAAGGSIKGWIISRQNTTVKAVQNIDITVLSGGTVNASAGGALSGTLVGMGGVNASGAGGITATMLSSSVSANGAAAQSTLGTATASAASQSAANQSGNDAKQELANSDNAADDDKKKRPAQPLMQRVKRVTVILPKT